MSKHKNDEYGLYYCRQCVALYHCGSSKMMEQEHMAQEHPAYHGSWDHFEHEEREASERFWDAYADRRWAE